MATHPFRRLLPALCLLLAACSGLQSKAPEPSAAPEVYRQHLAELEDRVYVVPEAIDAEVARLKLAALGITLDPMTPEQAAYVASGQHGT